MRTVKTAPWLALMVLLVQPGATRSASGQRVFLVVGRDTGALQAVSSTDVDVDGYTIGSPAGRLNPDGWDSLTDQGTPGWREANPRPEMLSELNWEGSSTLVAGEPIHLGPGYAGGSILPPEEDVQFQYTVARGTVREAAVFYAGPSLLPTVTVDRGTGLVELSNAGAFDITAYTIASAGGSLNPDGLQGLAHQGLDGWAEANPSSTAISELNLSSSLAFDADSRFSLGSVYTPSPLEGEDLTLQYVMPDGTVAEGVVDYIGPIPDLVLQVDLLSGAAQIQNLSPIAGPFELVGYSITSGSGALSVDNWSSFAAGGAAGEGWIESNPTANAIAELNPTGSTVFDQGTSIAIGNILSGADDLVFEYGTPAGAALGTVQYVLDLEPGLTCEDIAGSRIGGDFDGSGTVDFPDFVTLSNNWQSAVSSYEQGDADCSGLVDFADFVILSNNWQQSGGSVAAAVPEPAAAALAAAGMLVLLGIRRW
jgi:hypothetical protein